MIRSVSIIVVSMVMVLGLLVGSAGAVSDGSPQSYIVVLDRSTLNVPAVAADMAQAHGGQVGFVYEHAIRGFSMRMSPQAAAALARNPRVAYVETSDPVSIDVQSTPTGIERIFAETNASLDIDATDDYRVDVDVAVIDTGVDLEHPDLNVVGGVTCAESGGGPRWARRASCDAGGDDDHYHGTHVAGTIAALDNGIGVVGVAPGARVHAVKVLSSSGSGSEAMVVAGIDWVAANADIIEVANMSLGGSGFSQAEYDAIQGAVDAGVAFAVAAGNDNADAANYSPAAFDNALTVSALADFDGAPGGNGSPTCRNDQDDTLADFSNWGTAVQLAAPGVCIRSAFPIEQGEYGTISGTSMASPHVAGALALLASSSNPGDANDVYRLYDAVIGAGNLNWIDDSGDGIREPLLDVSDAALFAPLLVAAGGGGGATDDPPTVRISTPADGSSFDSGALISFAGSASDAEDGDLTSALAWRSDLDGDLGTGGSLSTTLSDGAHTITVSVADSGGNTGSDSITVIVQSSGGGGELMLSGSSTNNGSTWTATATLTGPVGASTSGTWDHADAAGGCTIVADAGSCSFSLSGIRKRVASVTYADPSDPSLTVTVAKP